MAFIDSFFQFYLVILWLIITFSVILPPPLQFVFSWSHHCSVLHVHTCLWSVIPLSVHTYITGLLQSRLSLFLSIYPSSYVFWVCYLLYVTFGWYLMLLLAYPCQDCLLDYLTIWTAFWFSFCFLPPLILRASLTAHVWPLLCWINLTCWTC